jgi:hypothetical protein
MFKSNRIDQDRRFLYLKEIHDIKKTPLPQDPGYNKDHKNTFESFLCNWSHSSQILITILLLFLAFLGLTGIAKIVPCR